MPHELFIYDMIGEGLFEDGITDKSIRDELAAIPKTERIVVRINSPGGDAFMAVAIHTMLSQWAAGVDVQIDGVAASAASLIATVGENVSIADGAMMMIHNAHKLAFGDANDMRRAAELLEKVNQNIARYYSVKSGQTLDDVLAAMDEETWMTSAEAVEFGLADDVLDSLGAVAYKIPDGLGFRHAPEPAKAESVPNRASVAAMARKIDLTRAKLRV